MLETIAIVLLLAWVCALATGATMGGYIHLLLVIAIVVVSTRLIRGRNPLK
jgi:hypothetical protein